MRPVDNSSGRQVTSRAGLDAASSSYEYVLTESGHPLPPIVIVMLDWGSRYASWNDAPHQAATDTACGEPPTWRSAAKPATRWSKTT